MAEQLHITVATSPKVSLGTTTISIEPELKLLKTALLYADKVKFCSLSSSILVMLLTMGQLDDEQLFYTLAEATRNEKMLKAVSMYKSLKKKKHLNVKENHVFVELSRQIQDAKKGIEALVNETAKNAGLFSLEAAINAGLVELQVFDYSDTREMAENFVDVIGTAILSGKTYPLFDEDTASLIDAYIKEGKLIPSEINVKRAQQIGLASDLLKRLPLFDDSPVDEIVDIRKELDRPLVKFRSAMISFSHDISNASWDKNFPLEAEQVLREHIEPAILEIEDACKSNKLLFNLMPKFFTSEVAASSFFGVMLAHATQLPDILGVMAGATVGTLEAVREWREKQSQIEGNQLYFYYKAGKLLSS